MEILVLIVILVLLFPPLFFVLLVPLLVALLLLLPIPLLFNALAHLYTVPRALLFVGFDRRLRRNHALEHATANVLEEKLGRVPLSGYAVKEGFKLFAPATISPELILSAAEEGLRRLKAGERELAIHRHCGTSLGMTNFLFAVLLLAILLFTKFFNLFYLLLGLLSINLLARPLGDLTQRLVTTSPDVKRLWIMGMRLERERVPFLMRLFMQEYLIEITTQPPIMAELETESESA